MTEKRFGPKPAISGRVPAFILTVVMLFAAAVTAYPIPREIEEALKLNRINHYDEALEVVEKALEAERIKPDITSAYTIGRILFRKGELYREMADISTRATIGYLKQVEEQDGSLPDELMLFLGVAYFFDRQDSESAEYLTSVVQRSSLDSGLDALARVYLGGARYRMGDEERASQLWKSVRSTEVLAYSTLGFIYAHLGVNPSTGEDMTRRTVEGLSPGFSGGFQSSFQIHHAYTLLRLGRFHEAYAAVGEGLLDKPIYVYRPDEKTELRFYDLSVLHAYSRILFGESIKNLEPIVSASSGELAGFSSYYVGQMYLYLNDHDQALKFARKSQKLSVNGSLTMMRAVACEVSALILSGKERKGVRIFSREIERVYGKSSFLLEMSKVVISSGVRYQTVSDVMGTIKTYISGTRGRPDRRDWSLTGELYFYTGDRQGAIAYLERARDKGNKNRIETNDPGFLLTLSYVYYQDEAYPESLEILFSLGKHFSGVRPLQDAVQSVYSYRQRGSGEAFIE
jgi:tetratricopeptide (TPR) repeat protein